MFTSRGRDGLPTRVVVASSVPQLESRVDAEKIVDVLNRDECEKKRSLSEQLQRVSDSLRSMNAPSELRHSLKRAAVFAATGPCWGWRYSCGCASHWLKESALEYLERDFLVFLQSSLLSVAQATRTGSKLCLHSVYSQKRFLKTFILAPLSPGSAAPTSSCCGIGPWENDAVIDAMAKLMREYTHPALCPVP